MLSTRCGLACAAAVFVCQMAAPVSAQPVDKRTTFKFSDPVALPGVTLPAGEYLFRLADPTSNTRVVQVLNAQGNKPYGLFFTIPAQRLEPASVPEVRFMETASGTPAAIRTWWYPGERTGHEFIFPKDQARRLAGASAQPVLTTQAQTTTTEQTNTAELSRVGSSGQETSVTASATPTATAPTGTSQEGQIASSALSIQTPSLPAIATAPAPLTTTARANSPEAAPTKATPRTELPKTATQLPAIAMLGTVSLLSAASLSYVRRRQR